MGFALDPEENGAATPSMNATSTMQELTSVWPGELPADQVALWARMSQAHRTLAISRLGLIDAYENGRGGKASELLKGKNLSLPRFNAILSAWRREKSLLALVPQARRRAPRAFVPPAGIEAAAARAVRDFKDSSLEAIARDLHERFEQPSLSWKRRLVARARRDFEREQAGGSSGFLSSTLVDSTALPLPLRSDDWDGTSAADDDPREAECEWAVAALAWDVATGYVLGHALGRAPSDMILHAAAAADAAERLRRMGETPDAGTVPVIATTIPHDPMGMLRVFTELAAEGVEVVHAARAPGSELMKAFDGRIGQLDLRPRFAADAFVGRRSRAEALAEAGRSPMSLADARLILDYEIEAHNAAVMKEGLTAAVAPSAVADSLDRIFGRYLRS